MEGVRNKGGRPRKRPDEVKGKVLRVRFTEAEHQALEAKAALCRKPLGVFLHDAALGMELKPKPELNREAWAKLGPLANNLNQVLRAKGRGEFTDLPAALLHEIKDAVLLLRKGLE